jgi:hypothetical protein
LRRALALDVGPDLLDLVRAEQRQRPAQVDLVLGPGQAGLEDERDLGRDVANGPQIKLSRLRPV